MAIELKTADRPDGHRELVLLHSLELQPRLCSKFKSVGAQLHKAADCCLSQAGGLVPRNVEWDNVCLLIGRSLNRPAAETSR
jgi:hypothetical protein